MTKSSKAVKIPEIRSRTVPHSYFPAELLLILAWELARGGGQWEGGAADTKGCPSLLGLP